MKTYWTLELQRLKSEYELVRYRSSSDDIRRALKLKDAIVEVKEFIKLGEYYRLPVEADARNALVDALQVELYDEELPPLPVQKKKRAKRVKKVKTKGNDND